MGSQWFYRICGIVLGTLAFLLCPLALMFRADTQEELDIGRNADILVGLLFAGAVFFCQLPVPSLKRRRWVRRTLIFVALVFAVTAGSLMLFHAAVAKVRFTVSPKMVTTNRILMLRAALTEYTRDCGSPPNEGQGLMALCVNPNVKGWSGPYLETKHLKDGWEEVIQYGIRDDHLQIWSCGRDKQSGTDDDIITTVD